jgi:hypothetical protein
MSRESSRRRLAALAAAVFALTAFAFVAGKAAGSGGAQAPTAGAVLGTHAPAPASPTALAAEEGSHLVAGVPVGYTDDEAGAVAAATAFSRVLGGPLLLKPAAYEQAVQAIAAPGERSTLARAASQQLTTLDQTYRLISLAHAGVPVSVTTIPLSYDVEAFAPENATVAVWAVGVMAAAGHLAPTAVWTTFDYHLTWTGEWRLRSISVVDAGWAPAEVQPTPATSDVPGQLGAYRRYSDASS